MRIGRGMFEATTVAVEVALEEVFVPVTVLKDFVGVLEVMVEECDELEALAVDTTFVVVCRVVGVTVEEVEVVFCFHSSRTGMSLATTATILSAVFR